MIVAIMAKWGPKSWEVSANKVTALEDLSFSYTQIADENKSSEDKKITNKRGTELFPLSFKTKLVAGLGVDICSEIISWKKLVTKANYFYLNGRKLYPKLLQLRKVDVSDIKTDNAGRMLTATLKFTFKEYDNNTSSVKVATSASKVKAGKDSKEAKKTTNSKVKKSSTKGIKVGSYVRMVKSDVSGKSYKVSKISGDKILLSNNKWVKTAEITLVK